MLTISLGDLKPGLPAAELVVSGMVIIKATNVLLDVWKQPGATPEGWPLIPDPPPGYCYVLDVMTGELFFQPESWSVNPISGSDITVSVTNKSK